MYSDAIYFYLINKEIYYYNFKNKYNCIRKIVNSPSYHESDLERSGNCDQRFLEKRDKEITQNLQVFGV